MGVKYSIERPRLNNKFHSFQSKKLCVWKRDNRWMHNRSVALYETWEHALRDGLLFQRLGVSKAVWRLEG